MALARSQHSQSKFGHRYDIVCDASVNAALFVGIGVALERAESTVFPLSTPALSIGSFTLGPMSLGRSAGAAVVYVVLFII